MGHSLPAYAFEGLGGIDLRFDRAAIGHLVFDRGRGIGWGEPDMAGVKSFLSSVGKAVGGAVKATAKGAINAGAATYGIGPIFPPGSTASLVYQQQQAAAPPPKPINYLPYVIGGGAALALAVVLISRRS